MANNTKHRIQIHSWECRFENGWHTASWENSRTSAQMRFRASVKQHTLAAGLVFSTAEVWKHKQEEAAGRHRDQQRVRWHKECDDEIKERLRDLYFANGGNEVLSITPSVYAVLKTEIDLVSESSMLYAAAATIAFKAGVCRDTVSKVNRMLEDFGILRRRESGGLSTNPSSKDFGRKTTNVYAFAHQALRRAIGIDCRYQSHWEAPADAMQSLAAGLCAKALKAKCERSLISAGGRGTSWHPFYNGHGFARRGSKSGKTGKPYGGKPYSRLIAIYECAVPALISALQPVKGVKNHLQDSQPYLSVKQFSGKPQKHKASTRQSRSFECRSANGNTQKSQAYPTAPKPVLFNPSKLPANVRTLLSQIEPTRRSWLLAETDLHLQELPSTNDYLWNATIYLEATINADNTLHNTY